MRKLYIILALMICLSFVACNNKHQCVEVPNPSTSPSETDDEAGDTSSLPETTEEGTPDMEIASDGYIDYILNDYYGVIYRGEDKITLIKDHSQLMKFYQLNGIAITDAYEEDFFKEKALAIVLATRGSGSCMVDIKHTRIKDNVLQVTLTSRMPEVGTCDMQYCAFAIEMAQEDIIGITEAEIITESTGVTYLFDDIEIDNGEDFELYRYSGTVEKSEERDMFASCGWLELITDEFELRQVLDRYTPTVNTQDSFERFADGLEDNFFNDKALILIPHYKNEINLQYQNSYYTLTDIVCGKEDMALYFYGVNNETTENSIQIAVISKDILKKNNVFNVFYIDTREETIDMSHCELTEESE